MKVKAKDNFGSYRLLCCKGLTIEQFRALQHGEIVDMSKEVYEENKKTLEVDKKEPQKVEPPKMEEVKDGD